MTGMTLEEAGEFLVALGAAMQESGQGAGRECTLKLSSDRLLFPDTPEPVVVSVNIKGACIAEAMGRAGMSSRTTPQDEG